MFYRSELATVLEMFNFHAEKPSWEPEKCRNGFCAFTIQYSCWLRSVAGSSVCFSGKCTYPDASTGIAIRALRGREIASEPQA